MPIPDNHHDDGGRPRRALFGPRRTLGLAAAGLLLLGGAAGAMVVAETRPTVSMAPAAPIAIRSLSAGGIVAIRGQVAEIFGNKVIVADSSGRALVDLGREGDDRQIVTAGEPITIQGRFDRGFMQAAFLVGPDNRVMVLGPLARPPHGPHGPDRGPEGPRDGGPEKDPAASPPAVASGPAPAAASATR